MKTKLIVTAAILVVGLAGITSPPRAWGQQLAQGSDQTIKEDLEHRLHKDYVLKGDDIEVAVANKDITLSGTVHTLAEKDEAERDAREESGYLVADRLTLKPTTLSDHQIADKIVQRLRRHTFYSDYDWLDVHVEDGVATLEGWLLKPSYADDFARQAEKIRGVRQVKNELQQLPDNPLDTKIRDDASHAIYTDQLFEWYGYDQTHPIHIIVENGLVILEGRVESEAHKHLAERLVRWNTDARAVSNLLKIGSIDSN